MSELAATRDRALTAGETDRLAELEQVVDRGLQTFVEVGTALAEIRDSWLYRATHRTFADYCRERWDLGRSRAYQLIDAAAVVSTIGGHSNGEPREPAKIGTTPPANERQARELVPLKDDEQALVDVWRQLRDKYGDDVTAEDVRRAVGVHARARQAGRRKDAEREARDDDGERRAREIFEEGMVVAWRDVPDPDALAEYEHRIKALEAEIERAQQQLNDTHRERSEYVESLWHGPEPGLAWVAMGLDAQRGQGVRFPRTFGARGDDRWVAVFDEAGRIVVTYQRRRDDEPPPRPGWTVVGMDA